MFTYRCPETLNEDNPIGKRVLVPLGKKIQTGVVADCRIIEENDIRQEYDLKDIICFLDDQPILTPCQQKLWKWVAEYYMCTLGEVMRAALPSALKLESDTHVALSAEYDETAALTPQQSQVVDLLSDYKQHDVQEIAQKLNIRSALPAVNKLISKGLVTASEQVTDSYKPKYESMVCLNDTDDLNSLIDSLNRAPIQQQTLLDYLALTDSQALPVPRAQLPQAAVAQLIKKGIFREQKQRISRLKERSTHTCKHPLTDLQQQAYNRINELFTKKQIVLLHGVTGSGKTDIYIHLIEQQLQKGNSVLYLVPEIALTTQLTERLEAVFGSSLLVYHSRFSDNERYEIYERTLNAREGTLVVGARSAVFLPLQKLGLVIVDEEHESSYKQQEPAPRYHARNVAIMLASFAQAKVLLGSATPSIESYFNASIGKYGLVELSQRYGGLQLPEVNVVDLREQRHRKQMTGHLSDPLVERLKHVVAEEHKQAIVFQNRRGYAPYVECTSCGYIPKCQNCDISLTYHRRLNSLSCHYCGFTIPLSQLCPSCKQKTLTDRGLGTEKAEDELQQLLPEAKIERMDLDTTRRKTSYQQLIDNFAAHKTDVLVGTQMLTKGLDFDNVGLVAVLNCDTILNQPDFCSSERAFQMLEQVSGRSGRKHERGEVMIQTTNPDNNILRLVACHDYKAFYSEQVAERQLFRYPPFYRLIYIVISDTDYQRTIHAAEFLQQQLKAVFTHRCSAVVDPLVERLYNRYIRQIILKFERNEAIGQAKKMIAEQIKKVNLDKNLKSVRIYADVDP